MRYQTLRRLQHIAIIFSLVALATIVLVVARVLGYAVPGLGGLIPQGLDSVAFTKNVALISGHAGNDSGAVCTNAEGQTTITEAAINADVAEHTAWLLRRAGADVLILDEFDARLAGLQSDVLLSLHADSCIDASGYKAARHANSAIGAAEDQLVACIDEHYAAVTGLPHHPNTITHNMTDYHAFRVIDPHTPAAIIELGFLGGDQDLLVNHADRVAQGIAESILCFFQTQGERKDAS